MTWTQWGGVTTTGLSCFSLRHNCRQDSIVLQQTRNTGHAVARSAEVQASHRPLRRCGPLHGYPSQAVGAERLREIMASLLDRATAVVSRYGGTVDKFTGDGVMAVFGAPWPWRTTRVQACRAALDIHAAIRDLAEQVKQQDRYTFGYGSA